MDAGLLALLYICLYVEKRDRGGPGPSPHSPLSSLSDFYNPGKQVFSS